MNLQVLVSALNKEPEKLIEKLRIDSDAIIINQCNENSIKHLKYKKHLIKIINTTDRGIGRSRKLALENANADIVLFADDDETLVDNYETIILDSFGKNKTIDFIVFEIDYQGNNKPRRSGRVHWWDSLKYGTTRFAVKRKSLLKKHITFDERFGASQYNHGEDSIFLNACLKAKLLVIKSNTIIAKIDNAKSTWFKGKDQKYYKDTGALFSEIFGAKAAPILVLNLLRHKTSLKNINLSLQGIKEYKQCS